MSLKFGGEVLVQSNKKDFIPVNLCLDCVGKFNKTLPSKNKFYSSLSGKRSSDKGCQNYQSLEQILNENDNKQTITTCT